MHRLPNYRVVNASAQETGLPSESYDAVVGEAMLTMQTDDRLEIMRGGSSAASGRLLRYSRMSLVPDYPEPRS